MLFFEKTLKYHFLENFLEKLFALRKKYRDERNELVQVFFKLLMNSLHGVQIRKNINKFYKCKSQYWMETVDDDIVLDKWRLTNGNYIVKPKKDDILDGDNDLRNTIRSHLGVLILSNSK